MKQFIIILLCGAFLTRLFLYIAYERVLRIAYNVSHSNHELIKQIKLRYTNCNTLDIPITNISAFIKKHILLNCGFKRIIPCVDIAGYIMIMSSLALACIYYGSNQFFESSMQTPLIVFMIILMMFILLNGIIRGEEKLNQATVLIADYLENVLSHRNINKREKVRERRNNDIDKRCDCNSKDDTVVIPQKEEQEGSKKYVNSIPDNTIGKLINSAADTKHAENIINEVLKEYLA